MRPSGGVSAPSQAVLDATGRAAHTHCLLCGAENPQGLGLQFRAQPDGSVRALFAGSSFHEGYPGTLHGGLIAALIDAAMTNCLFAHGVVAVTARLNLRYIQPARPGTAMEVVATLERSGRSLHYLSGEVRQNGGVVAAATATFKDRPPDTASSAGLDAACDSPHARSHDCGQDQEH